VIEVRLSPKESEENTKAKTGPPFSLSQNAVIPSSGRTAL